MILRALTMMSVPMDHILATQMPPAPTRMAATLEHAMMATQVMENRALMMMSAPTTRTIAMQMLHARTRTAATNAHVPRHPTPPLSPYRFC